MFDKFFNSEKKTKEKTIKNEEKTEKETIEKTAKDEQNKKDNSPCIDENYDDYQDNFYTNRFRVEPSSSRIYFNKNAIITANNLTNTQYLIKKELGRGAFSNVYLAYAKNENEVAFDLKRKYVLKTTKYKPLYASQAVKEYQYYNKIDNKSKYIIHFEDFFSIPNCTKFTTPCLVLEYFNENFYNYMKINFKKNYGLNINILLIVTKAMVLGIDFLHKHDIIHCDLKPENIVINDKNQCKIIDLGSAIKNPYDDKNCYMQSRYYRSPNCIVACDINPRIDYWGIGCIMYEMLTMIPLFCRNHENDILLKQLRFINIPHSKINRLSSAGKNLYDYEWQRWRQYIQKIDLFDYLELVLQNKKIKRYDYEKKWIFDKNTGYYSLIKICILNHYNKDENDYVKQFEIIEEMYNYELKFPAISTT